MAKDKELGRRIRKKRKEKGFSLAKLAEKIGCTSSFLSQVERGKTEPSITSLRQISKALDEPIFYFLLDADKHNPIVRKNERKILTFPSKLTFELLSPDLKRQMELIHAELEPGAYTCETPLSHSGEECTLVLKGKMEFQIDDKYYILEEGDSIYYYASIPHKITSVGEENLIFVSAITPPNF